jgi:hypothetical protein
MFMGDVKRASEGEAIVVAHGVCIACAKEINTPDDALAIPKTLGLRQGQNGLNCICRALAVLRQATMASRQ